MAEITPIIAEPEGRILHRLTAYMDGDAYPEHTRLTQYDTTLPILAVSLQCSGRPYEVPTAGTVSVRMRKPDGHHVYNPALGLSSDRTTAYIVITSQMTAAAGNAELAIEVMADGGIAASGILSATVVSNPVPESAYESTDEMRSITELAAQVEQAATKLEQYKAAAETAAASAAQASAGAESARDDAETAARTATSQAASATGSASAASQSAASAQSYCEQSREVAEDFADIKRLAEFVEIDDGTLKLDGGLEANGHVTATGSLVAGQNVVIPNDGSVYIYDVNNVARRMLTITSANAATVGHSALPLSVYGSGITLAGATTISGNLSNTGTISAGSSVNATTGVAAGNGHGLYVKNASGSLVKLFWLTDGNVCTVGSNDYATSILGKTITASKTITVSSDRRLKRDITVLDGRHQAIFDRLRPVSYRLREDEDGKEHIGLVAQEVQEALEQSGLTNSALVQADSEGMLSIGYGELIGLLVDEVQTLKARVKALEARLDAGEGKAPDPDEIPAWRPWDGLSALYAKGNKVTHGGKTWVSLVDNNCWEPGIIGTKLVWREV